MKEVEMEVINKDTDLDIILSSTDLGPSFSQSSCVVPRPVFKELTNAERDEEVEERTHEDISQWSTDLAAMPSITQEKIHQYLVLGNSCDSKPKGATKHKILGYQLFKESYVKKVRVKSNVMAEKLTFLVKCFVAASMKREKYSVYVHLCQRSGDILYAKCLCKAGAGGCCKHVAAVLFQLVEYKQLDLKIVPDDKTCTALLQK